MKKTTIMAFLLGFVSCAFAATTEVTSAAQLSAALGAAASGDTVLLKVNASVSALTVPEGVTLDVHRDATLTNTGVIDNNGTIGVIGKFVNTGATLNKGENGKLVLKTQVYAIETRTRKHTSGTEFKYDVTRTQTGTITGATADKYQVSADDDDAWHDAVDETGAVVTSPGQTIVCTYGSSSVFENSTNMNRTRRYLYSVAAFTSTPALFERKGYYSRIVILLSNVTGLSKQAGVNSSASPFSVDMAGHTMSGGTYCFSIGNNTPFKLLNGTVGGLDAKNGAKFFFINASCGAVNANVKNGALTFWFADGTRGRLSVSGTAYTYVEYLLSGEFTSSQVGNYTQIYGGNFQTMPASTKLASGRTVLCGTGSYPYQVMSEADAAAQAKASSVLAEATTYYSSADAAIANAAAGSVITIHDPATTARQLTADGDKLTLILEDGATYNPALVTASSTSKCKVTYVQTGNTIVFTCSYDEAQCEAKIGATLYPQLSTALKLISSSLNGKTVILLKDISSCTANRSSTYGDATYTIDLNGHSFGFGSLGTSTSYKKHYITIVDSSEGQTGRYTDKYNFSAKCVIQQTMGGTFTKFNPADYGYVPEGYKSVANGDGTYTVVMKGALVARIGEVEYETLEAAIANVKSGDTVELLADCSENVMAGTVAFTFAPGGYNWSGTITTASGYVLIDNGDGTYGYMIEPDVINVGGVPYKSLASALAAIPTDGSETTVELLADVNLGVLGASAGITFATGMNVVLDLAGYSIFAEGAVGTCLLRNEGVLTITDTSADTIGVIGLDGLGTLIESTGTLAVEYGTFTASKFVNGDGEDVPLATIVEDGVAVVKNGNGTWTIAPYPKANIIDMDQMVLSTSNARVADNTFDGEITFPFTTDMACSFQIVQDAKVNPVFKDWVGDFTLTFDRTIPKKSVVLAGQTGSYGTTWRALHTGRVDLPVGKSLRMLQSVDSYWGTIRFSSIYGSYKQVQTAICNTLESNYGANMVVEFRLFEVDEGVETGNYITVASRNYKFVNPEGDVQVEEADTIDIVQVAADNTETVSSVAAEDVQAQSEKIQQVVAEFKENKAVIKGADTGVYEQSVAKKISVKLKSLRIEENVVNTESVQTVMSAEFDVKPVNDAGEPVSIDAGTVVTFRLPVDSAAENCYAAVYHEGAFNGNYPVREEGGDKFIEIIASDFSSYMYMLKDGDVPSVAKIDDVYYVSLEEAFASAIAGDTIELTADATLTNEIAVAKTIILDLGEFTVTAGSGKSAIQVVAGGNLTVAATTGGITSASGYAIYTDYEKSAGMKAVTINDGTFSSVQFNKYPLQTSVVQSGEAATPTTVTINGGTFNENVKIYHCPTTIAGGTFSRGLDTSASSVAVYSNSQTPIRITGGKFKTEPVDVGSRVIVNDGYYQDGWFVIGNTSWCEVKRNGKFYRYASEAFAAVGADTRIEILKSDSVAEINVTIGEGQALTVPSSFAAVSAASGLTLEATANTADGTVTYTARAAGKVAKIGGTYYDTLDAAFAGANDGDTITLVDNATLGITALDKNVTLALAEKTVTVTTDGIDLASGKLAVTGVGLVSKIPVVTKDANLAILGGTWTVNPSKYVPEIVTALPNEQADMGWRKDRYYVFNGKAFVGGAWGDAPGYWTVVPLPKAYVTSMDEKPSVGGFGELDCAYTFDSFNTENGDDEIADAFLATEDFSAFSDPIKLARAKELLMEKMPFLDWNADFVVSLDRDVAVGDLALSGHYANWDIGWVTYEAPNDVESGEKIRLLVDIGQATPGDWPYENICRYVRTFDCGAKMLNSAIAGTTMTVQLRLYKPDTDQGLGSPSIIVCEYKYTFGGKAARIVRNSENLDYDSLAEAFGAVASNEVIIALNDYSDATTISDCKKPFTVDVNGFGWTGTVTPEEKWTFKQLSNRNFCYYSVPEEKTTMVEIVSDNGETVTLSPVTVDDDWYEQNVAPELEGVSEEEVAAKVEEVMAQPDDNGLAKWQNYVIGQNPSAAVRVDTAQAPINNTPVENTLTEKVNVPAGSGFTVAYELDKIQADGTVVEGTPQATAENFTIDLEDATDNEAGVAYFKMAAVIKATDGSGAKTKVASENTIGVLKVESDARTTAIAVPWESLGGGDISVSNIVRTANLTPGDELKAYAPDGKYKAWELSESNEWEPVTVVGGSSQTDADDFTVKRGSAVWLTRQDTSTPIYLVGEVAESEKATVTLEAGSKDNPSWNLVGSTGTEPVNVETLMSGNTADKLSVPTAYVPKNYVYVEGQGWGYYTSETYTYTDKKGVEHKRVRNVFKTDDNYVPAGTGFWYQNSGVAKDINL